MSIVPPLFCPPDYSKKLLRFITCNKFGISKGKETLTNIDLNNFYVEINDYLSGENTLNPGSTFSLPDLQQIPVYEKWILKEANIYENEENYEGKFELFIYDNCYSFEFIKYSDISLYETLNIELVNYPEINSLISFELEGDDIIVCSLVSNTRIKSILRLNKIQNFIEEEYDKNIISEPLILFKNNKTRAKFIGIFPQYDKIDFSNCGCVDASGFIKPENKVLKWKVSEIKNIVNTGIILKSSLEKTDTFNYEGPHPLYYFNQNSIIILKNEGKIWRTKVLEIGNETIKIESPIFLIEDSEITIENNIEWKNLSDIMILTGGCDCKNEGNEEKDGVENIQIYNPQKFSIPIKWIIAK